MLMFDCIKYYDITLENFICFYYLSELWSTHTDNTAMTV